MAFVHFLALEFDGDQLGLTGQSWQLLCSVHDVVGLHWNADGFSFGRRPARLWEHNNLLKIYCVGDQVVFKLGEDGSVGILIQLETIGCGHGRHLAQGEGALAGRADVGKAHGLDLELLPGLE